MESFINPEKILRELTLHRKMVACDFGSGSGGWVIPLAKKLESGKVYAIDVLEEPLSVLNGKIALEKIYNVQIIRSDVEKEKGSTLPNESVDLVLMTNLLFQCEDKKSVLKEGKRVLKPGGKILIVDWIKDNPLTPEIEYVSFEEIKEIVKGLGLKTEKDFEIGEYHQGLIVEK